MGLYRTIPQDVEAVQYGGMKDDEPVLREMGAALPGWLWKAITKGQVSFDTAGVKVNGRVLKDDEWIIFDGVFIDSMDNEKFTGTFVPARKPLSEMATAPKSLSVRRTRDVVQEVVSSAVAVTASPEAQAVTGAIPQNAPASPVTAADVTIGNATSDVIPDDVDDIMNRLNGTSTETV